ncbi:hypothetical protein ASE75_05795 [Sphingomonas sp. Leaf17]|uniref:class I SAM-dependent methyltransferase n=1 Tax=Sphingomonas sp. Leaf17 TaxID=1735683 RepID=UPI0006F6EF53|nr:class I SAM-dependent methyltransferase [Sphingomonas sp. Leaf17]KQM65743.1 hypothetical protein ASE75_05795 [Sphingomonas sp. Leaf17]
MTQSFDWTGPVGDVWAAEWARTDRSFRDLSPHLDAAILSAAPPGPFRAVDLGAGAGATALALASARPDADVLGIDLSAALVAVARERAGGSRNVHFRAGDVLRVIADTPPADLYCSRHGVMFFDDPAAAFAMLATRSAPDASLVFSCFAARAANRWAIEPAVALGGAADVDTGVTPGPFAFADPAHVEQILTRGGWIAAPPRRVAFDYVAGDGEDCVADATAFFGRIGPAASLLREAPDRARAVAALSTACAARRIGNRVVFPAVAWIWSAKRPAGAGTP